MKDNYLIKSLAAWQNNQMFERLVLERIARILVARDFIIGMEGGAENLLQLYHGEGGYSLAKSDGAIGRIGRIGLCK